MFSLKDEKETATLEITIDNTIFPTQHSSRFEGTSSTSLKKLENILDDNGEGTKRVEEMLRPARPELNKCNLINDII
ncbi:hypothetical protein RB195_000016 [Necator americanus]|uniref:Uncharacterized protein n=1 Tax=Necator americanus TaxID=51031 RepID=A0ABR1D8F1_NECAM